MKAQVYFDGACHLCYREIEFYKKKQVDHLVEFIDISAEGFDAKQFGLDPVAVNEEMHVRAPDGSLHVGVNAFIALWKVLPGYQNLARVSENAFVKPALKVGYHVFARYIRPNLPKRQSGTCSIPRR